MSNFYQIWRKTSPSNVYPIWGFSFFNDIPSGKSSPQAMSSLPLLPSGNVIGQSNQIKVTNRKNKTVAEKVEIQSFHSFYGDSQKNCHKHKEDHNCVILFLFKLIFSSLAHLLRVGDGHSLDDIIAALPLFIP